MTLEPETVENESKVDKTRILA